jgi:hypothetical protein
MKGLRAYVTILCLALTTLGLVCLGLLFKFGWLAFAIGVAGFVAISTLAEIGTGIILYTRAEFIPEHKQKET